MKRAVIVLVFLVACGGSGAWSNSQREEFMAGCTDAAPVDFTEDQLAELTDLCECSAEKAEDAGIDDPDEITEAKANEWAQACAE
jgi:hypothetical protein